MKFDLAAIGRLFDFRNAFQHPVTTWVVVTLIGLLVAFGILLPVLRKSGRVDEKLSAELSARWKSWCWLVVLMLAPILLGAAWTILAVALLGVLCYREYSRVLGVFREPILSACVVLGVALLAFASLDHFDRLYFALGPLVSGLIVVSTLIIDRPQGYVQRTAIALFGFQLFGFSLGYMGLLTNISNLGNGTDYRPVLLLILVAVEMNDIFAFCCGKLIGGPKLLPTTSPGKTIAGSVGALLLTTILVAGLGHAIFYGTAVDRWFPLLALGALISILGQLGDLILSSIKRDIGVKDMGNLIPGHGGLLDRFDSLVLVPPAVFHFLSLLLGPLGAETPLRIFTGGH